VRRAAARILALAAVVAVGAALLAIVLGQGGGEGSGGGRTGPGASAAAAGDRHAAAPATAKVRNASPQPSWRPYSGPVPIFRYHVVGEAAADEPTPELFVPPADFSAQMDWLEAHGYEAVGLEAVQRAWFDGGTLPARPVVLSFDGVEGDLLSAALPDLRRRGWPGVLVLDAGAPAGDDAAVEKLLAAGWELEAEAAEPGGEGKALERRFGAPVRDYAFPQGEFDEATVPAVEAAGYEGATANGGGFAEADDPFDLPRITIYGLSGVEGFAEAVRSRGEGVGA
jgi:peptidoglycan/xylan/chitin deacetylase (PgdA/CDA1 family)